ncbi:hypothetical protein ACIA6T_04155 [Streptomyces sp. NPDC051740]|uniref:hypothetical protein n=1 Tax=Streptomyces sp. NPDC051740 TaxID=3365673 RepID=UPI0037B97417
MPAHDEHRDAGNAQNAEYDGMDALMAAILDEPLPARARQDPAFTAAHRAAAADVAVLRERLALIGDALAAPGEETADGAVARPAVRTPAGGRPGTVRGPRGPHRGRRRPLKAALGALVAAAAATVVVGTGWLVTQAGGVSDSDAGSSAARADSKEAGGEEAAGVAFGSPRYLACARLVAEGTVLAVDPVPGAEAERVTLRASRYYKGEGEVAFLRDLPGDTPLREGDLVLVGMPPDGVHPDTVVAGEAAIAPERARIIASLPESRTLTCD